jgi:hypothetical protein
VDPRLYARVSRQSLTERRRLPRTHPASVQDREVVGTGDEGGVEVEEEVEA